ncbi:MAG: T9SS type A sorting domain-containing protein [Bacteroidetes bacterium]|nr:T9SS type A sorting domain-containing protein [Bacteroidota bacterium]
MPTLNASDASAIGDYYALILLTYLNLYKTTGDKAYLIKFINDCIEIQQLRYDESNQMTGQNVPYWTCYCILDNNGDNWAAARYIDGRVIYPMAEFVYMVNYPSSPYYQELHNTIVPAATALISNNNFGINFSNYSFSVFASWLDFKVRETINLINAEEWGDGGIQKINGDRPLPANMQSTYAAALLLIGLVENIQDYQDKAFHISQEYKSSIDYFRDDNCEFGPSKCFSSDFLEVNAASNSYYWSDAGWSCNQHNHCSTKRCSDCDWHVKEDINHAVFTLIFPRAVYNTGQVWGFSSDDMVRFHNTLTRNIYVGSNSSQTGFFWANVQGGNDLTSDGIDQTLDHTAFAYMPFYKFDGLYGSQQSVYDILMPFYSYLLSGYSSASSPNHNFFMHHAPGTLFYGLSEIVSAQWNKENPNLTLYNRDVVYDQDFFAKDKLIVAPAETTDTYYTASAFAEPKITTPDFIVESNIAVEMTARNQIILKKGFHAKGGCTFHAHLDPNAGNRMNTNAGNNEIVDVPLPAVAETTTAYGKNSANENKQQDTTAAANNNHLISPNPTTGIFQIQVGNGQLAAGKEYKIEIYNVFGEKVTQSNIPSGARNLTIDLSSQPKGIYLLKIIADRGEVNKKIIINK